MRISFWESKIEVTPELLETIVGILEGGELSVRAGGPYVVALEKQLCLLTGRKFAVAVSSATTGLMILLSHPRFKSSQVVMPAFTFLATMTSAQWNNITPIFCDVDPDTWTLDAESVERNITSHTTAIIPVNMFGNPSNYTDLEGVARDHSIPLIVDAAQGLGAKYDGKAEGSFGLASVISFSPSKVITGGEGGIILTDDDDIYQHCLRGRHYGDDGTYNPTFPGINAKLTEVQAAIILSQIPLITSRVVRAWERAKLYKCFLPDVTFQKTNGQRLWKECTILVPKERRDKICVNLLKAGIDHRKYWSVPLHHTTAYQMYEHKSGYPILPITEDLADRVVSLPMHSGLSVENIRRISEIVNGSLC